MTRLNVENLEGRALMSATLTGAISAPTLDAAVVRVVDDGAATEPSASNMDIKFADLLISSFKASDPVPMQSYVMEDTLISG